MLNVRFRLGLAAVIVAAVGGLLASVAVRAQVPAPAPSVWDGVYTDVQAKAGESTFQSYCLECHGEDLAGREQAPALAGPPFLEKWNKATLKKLMDTLEAMPPDNPKSLTAKQYIEVLAYILNANEFPVGKTALPEDRSVLSTIQILGTRPDTPAH